ncbi:hypothetical protein [Nitratiruptor tergarcus]|uniref:LTXXQ motif family protein n=1 Tax=Nitratiruptor tergarcus DSM 16512 TaxID=1069081 RepID=A0A1W1WQW5_9BACT|nr:hypothetical protein [Nitratiruptor tergarcus]SMC08636.1 hypothetical protein SAMN05660197_0395 [Nitratiruptor tergarcus DSM 16512]
MKKFHKIWISVVIAVSMATAAQIKGQGNSANTYMQNPQSPQDTMLPPMKRYHRYKLVNRIFQEIDLTHEQKEALKELIRQHRLKKMQECGEKKRIDISS